MSNIQEFEKKLMGLNPNQDDFVLHADELIDSMSEENHEKMIPSIFKFFEAYPLNDCGAPGTLVHFIENFYPNYKSLLLSSLHNQPSVNAILMVNRILNSDLSNAEREEYLAALNSVALTNNLALELKAEAVSYIEHQSSKYS